MCGSNGRCTTCKRRFLSAYMRFARQCLHELCPLMISKTGCFLFIRMSLFHSLSLAIQQCLSYNQWWLGTVCILIWLYLERGKKEDDYGDIPQAALFVQGPKNPDHVNLEWKRDRIQYTVKGQPSNNHLDEYHCIGETLKEWWALIKTIKSWREMI